jgi:hypothetical protein
LPWHSVWPGAHEPVQAVPMQVWFTQFTGLPNVPPEHVSSPLPEQSVWPGVHDPEQAPPTQVDAEHVTAVPHVPLVVQLWTPLLVVLHCVCPGAHWPVHPPLMHVWFVQAAGVPQAPAALHVCTPFPEHCLVPGVQATQALFKQAGVDPEQVTAVCHSPLALHD